MAVHTNRQILTRGKNYATKQSKKFGTDEVTFDKDSRLDYLTGFHKRKVQRQKKAQEFVKEQERLRKIEERQKIRQERKEIMEEQLKTFKEGLNLEADIEDAKKGEIDDFKVESDDSWHGFDSGKEDSDDDSDERNVRPILKKEAITETYDDSTTVEVETLEPNDNFEYLAHLNNVKLEKAEKVLNQSINRATKYAKFLGVDDKQKKKPKVKKFRYLTKNERRVNQRKANDNKRRR
ncbi:hypothetical protein SKDZ_04G6100 [Saccharomyces kudriavzevii ZP591]|uniref:RRP17-like protein n=2 Tax=Saccharomyces kudriavzevii (strain ATCC MYA-4449 / AS 2.2408 / CBS 8840 / NBRC 1802 / NCYC 2889) TaxID=226230 RepID=J6EE77_SACK1|nr:uncharacterized protein SKDI_04G6210 [Saccharomyces kudriavzevii IFO 1802]EJT41937.1 RRP17-like protein [Saccharomyces kudriavzevii IFO 1802]CAI4059193.1 hypothetical protein SKDZ_04G6100 [Saccharomyces kudriavzevii ZP591]CAI4059208.1 hypothetical protein SKDI_04G6210 [Saccharomyces kudriavzevii IFO 1802]